MGRDTLRISDLILDLSDAIENMYGDYGGPSVTKIQLVRYLLDQLEDELKEE